MPTVGRDFYALMRDQSRRAAEFDRRLRWSVLRKDLSETYAAEERAVEVVDLRPSEARPEPPQQD